MDKLKNKFFRYRTAIPPSFAQCGDILLYKGKGIFINCSKNGTRSYNFAHFTNADLLPEEEQVIYSMEFGNYVS